MIASTSRLLAITISSGRRISDWSESRSGASNGSVMASTSASPRSLTGTTAWRRANGRESTRVTSAPSTLSGSILRNGTSAASARHSATASSSTVFRGSARLGTLAAATISAGDTS